MVPCKVVLVLQFEQGQVQDCFRLLEVRKTLICIASGLLDPLGSESNFLLFTLISTVPSVTYSHWVSFSLF